MHQNCTQARRIPRCPNCQQGTEPCMANNDGLTPQLVGLEGWRVEVETTYGEVRRFNVGRSTGWQPCHIELYNVRSHGGIGAEREYKRVTPIRKVR